MSTKSHFEHEDFNNNVQGRLIRAVPPFPNLGLYIACHIIAARTALSITSAAAIVVRIQSN
jgi:hypothetical protein